MKCPRCLASIGDPCRNGRGEPHSSGHADRRRLADRTLAKRRSKGSGNQTSRGRTRDQESQPQAAALTPQQLAQREVHRAEQQQRAGATGTPSNGGGLDPMQAAFTARRGKWVDDGNGVARRLPRQPDGQSQDRPHRRPRQRSVNG